MPAVGEGLQRQEVAKVVLGKVAKVINDKPDFEAMIEGHTDSRSYASGVLLDNWDLGVKTNGGPKCEE